MINYNEMLILIEEMFNLNNKLNKNCINIKTNLKSLSNESITENKESLIKLCVEMEKLNIFLKANISYLNKEIKKEVEK